MIAVLNWVAFCVLGASLLWSLLLRPSPERLWIPWALITAGGCLYLLEDTLAGRSPWLRLFDLVLGAVAASAWWDHWKRRKNKGRVRELLGYKAHALRERLLARGRESFA